MTEPEATPEPEVITEKADLLVRLRKEADAASEKTLEALSDLIIATLKSPASDRFAEARRLCDIGQALFKARGRRADDFKKVAYEEDGPEENIEYPRQMAQGVRLIGGGRAGGAVNVMAYNTAATNTTTFTLANAGQGQIAFDDQGRLVNEVGVAYTGPLDANSLMRHMLVTFGPHAQTGAEANRARVAAEETAELKLLVALLSGATDPEKSIVEKRIAQLMTHMEMRTQNGKPDDDPQEVHVVPADDSRGHPVGEGGPEADGPAGVRADDAGAAGDGAVAHAGALDPVGAQAVG